MHSNTQIRTPRRNGELLLKGTVLRRVLSFACLNRAGVIQSPPPTALWGEQLLSVYIPVGHLCISDLVPSGTVPARCRRMRQQPSNFISITAAFAQA
jgi:hypothetical protein